MAVSSFHLGTILFLLLASQSPMPSLALIQYPKAISDLRDATVKSLGLQSEDLKVSGFDIRDARVGHTVAYEFDVEIDKKVLPFKLLEDIKRWDYADLPIFRVEDAVRAGDENGIVEKSRLERHLPPVLAPFQLAGPMELWIQDAKDMRISLPHDVEAGVLKKVILAEGAVVTVKGARSVSLRHPLDLPLPLNRTGNAFATGLLTLAEWLHLASRSQDTPLLSLRIVGPTSIAASSSSSSSSPSSSNRLKLKRLAPGLVELSSLSRAAKDSEALPAIDRDEATSLLSPNQFTTLWPVVSVNGSNSNLLGFEKLLASVLGPKAGERGSFKLLKADVSAQTSVKIGFSVEKKLKEGDGVDWSGFPSWRTRPENVSMHFEVLAKVDGDKVVPERVVQVNPISEDTVGPEMLSPNVSMSRVPIVYHPPDPFAL